MTGTALPNWIDREAWDGFVAMRRAMKKVPFTARAEALVVKELYKIKAAGHCPNAALDQSTLNGWRDVYVPKDKSIQQVKNDAAETAASLNAERAREFKRPPAGFMDRIKAIRRVT